MCFTKERYFCFEELLLLKKPLPTNKVGCILSSNLVIPLFILFGECLKELVDFMEG